MKIQDRTLKATTRQTYIRSHEENHATSKFTARRNIREGSAKNSDKSAVRVKVITGLRNTKSHCNGRKQDKTKENKGVESKKHTKTKEKNANQGHAKSSKVNETVIKPKNKNDTVHNGESRSNTFCTMVAKSVPFIKHPRKRRYITNKTSVTTPLSSTTLVAEDELAQICRKLLDDQARKKECTSDALEETREAKDGDTSMSSLQLIRDCVLIMSQVDVEVVRVPRTECAMCKNSQKEYKTKNESIENKTRKAKRVLKEKEEEDQQLDLKEVAVVVIKDKRLDQGMNDINCSQDKKTVTTFFSFSDPSDSASSETDSTSISSTESSSIASVTMLSNDFLLEYEISKSRSSGTSTFGSKSDNITRSYDSGSISRSRSTSFFTYGSKSSSSSSFFTYSSKSSSSSKRRSKSSSADDSSNTSI